MAFRDKTLRRMSPEVREVARLIGELESVARRLKNRLPSIAEGEAAKKALETAKQAIAPLSTEALKF